MRAVRKVVCSRTDIHLFPGIPRVQDLKKAHTDAEYIVTSTCSKLHQSLDIRIYIYILSTAGRVCWLWGLDPKG